MLELGGAWAAAGDRGSLLVDSGRPIPSMTMAVHHIVDADVSSAGR